MSTEKNLFSDLRNEKSSTFSGLICRCAKVRVPFELCQRILLSSFRAGWRFSSWSCRRMVSSVGMWTWMCPGARSWRSCRASRARGIKIRRCSPIAVHQSPNLDTSAPPPGEETNVFLFVCFPSCSKSVNGNLPADWIHPGFLQGWSHDQSRPPCFNKIRVQHKPNNTTETASCVLKSKTSKEVWKKIYSTCQLNPITTAVTTVLLHTAVLYVIGSRSLVGWKRKHVIITGDSLKVHISSISRCLNVKAGCWLTAKIRQQQTSKNTCAVKAALASFLKLGGIHCNTAVWGSLINKMFKL